MAPRVASIPATVATAAILLASLQTSADAMNAPFEYLATYALRTVDTQRVFQMAYERDGANGGLMGFDHLT